MLRERWPEVTRVFVANDHMALGLVRALAESGVDVPGDVSVVGFDDIAEAEYLRPPADDGAPDFAEVGGGAASTWLLERIGTSDRWFLGRPVVGAGRLVVRASTAPVRR